MTVTKYTRSLIEYGFKKIQIKKKHASQSGATALLTAILRLDYQFSFPDRGAAETRPPPPRQKSLTNDTDDDTKTTETYEEMRPKLSEGRRQQEKNKVRKA